MAAFSSCRKAQPFPDDTSRSLSASSLPTPDRVGSVSLEQLLGSRRSVRSFGPAPLTSAQIGQLAWAATGWNDDKGQHRTAPSAGALFPMELYVVTSAGISHYLPSQHALEPHMQGDKRAQLSDASLGQQVVRDAPCVIVLTGVVAKTSKKYGDRARRFIAMEAGHMAQNILLQATALKLGAVPVGGIDDAAVGKVLGLPDGEEVLYLIPVGTLK